MVSLHSGIPSQKILGTYSGNMSADTLTVGCKRNVKPEMQR